jgi:hypothetical protein
MTGRNDQPANQTAATRERAQIYLGGSAFSASQTSSGFHESCVAEAVVTGLSSKLGQTFDKTACLRFGAPAIEVGRAEIVIE